MEPRIRKKGGIGRQKDTHLGLKALYPKMRHDDWECKKKSLMKRTIEYSKSCILGLIPCGESRGAMAEVTKAATWRNSYPLCRPFFYRTQ